MTIVIEYVILDNMTFNYLLFYLASKTVKETPRHGRLLLASFLGTLAAIGFSLVALPSLITLALKILLAPLLCYAAGGFVSVKTFLRYNLFFLAYTFILGGIILSLFYLGDTAVTALSAVNYSSSVPVGVFIAAAIALLLGGNALAGYIKFKRKFQDKIVEADIILDKVYRVRALTDTGNSLTSDGLPVCFIVNGALKKRLAHYFARCLAEGSLRTVTFDTVAGKGAKNAVPADISAYGRTRGVLLSTADAQSGQFELLLNSCFLEGEE